MRVSPSDALIGAKSMLSKYKRKLLYLLEGNHGSPYGNRNKKTNIGPEEDLANMLNIKYGRYAIAITIDMLNPDNSKIKPMTICLKHEVQNPQAFIQSLVKRGVVPDVIIREHTHDGNDGMYMTQIPVYNKDGTLKGFENHQVEVVTGKSMQNGNTYYGGEKSFDLKTNVKGLFLSWDRNPYYTANDVTQPKYVPNVATFDVLDRNENKPSLMTEMLLRYYEEPNSEAYRKNVERKPLGQIASSLDAAIRTTNEKLGRFVEYEKNLNMGE